jgi:hypothetical protein
LLSADGPKAVDEPVNHKTDKTFVTCDADLDYAIIEP